MTIGTPRGLQRWDQLAWKSERGSESGVFVRFAWMSNRKVCTYTIAPYEKKHHTCQRCAEVLIATGFDQGGGTVDMCSPSWQCFRIECYGLSEPTSVTGTQIELFGLLS